MSRYIQAAKDQMTAVVDQARSKFGVELRVAFVGYRDFGEIERFAIKDFVAGEDGIEELRSFIASTPARSKCPSGDIDPTEDVAGGLEKALGLSWSNRVKLLVHVADAPAHGEEYHDGMGDNHGGPQSPDPAELMSQFAQKKVSYYFFKINDSTEKMVRKLREAHKPSRREFKEVPFGGDVEGVFADMVLGSIAGSVVATGVTLPTGTSELGAGASSGAFSPSVY